jgi:serine/threonine protein kinase/curli biogenesis system outer membrane secretion channel CsgG
MSETSFPEVGQVVDGRYEILSKLGSGGMGAVYKAAFKPLGGRFVALKILKPDVGAEQEFRKRFEREAQIAATLEHPAIVRVTDFGKLSSGLLYMALEYVEGEDLRRNLKRYPNGMPVERAARIAWEILDALAVAHRAGVIHRDLKPANIMLSNLNGREIVKVLDFGIARIMDGESLTLAGQIIGSAPYMAPEQTRAEAIDQRADIYAIGCLLYELATGRPPFNGSNVTEIIKLHRKQVPLSPDKIRPDLPPAFVALILQSLEKDPARRPQKAQDFAMALEQCLCPQPHSEDDLRTITGGLAMPSENISVTNSAPEGNTVQISGSQVAALYASQSGSAASSGAIEVSQSASFSTSLYSRLEGQVLDGKYRVEEKLGEGGMGAVYRVTHLMLNESMALKVMHPQQAQDPTFRERFQREVQVMMKFVHPNAVTVREYGISSQGLLYMTMDYSTGRPLKELIASSAPLPPKRALGLARQVLEALGEGHRKGIVHRDIKPDNILIEREDGEDHVKVLDFGIAKILQDGPDKGDGKGIGKEKDQANLTGSLVIGTPHYMSPEQAGGEAVDNRADLYAVGCVLYELLCGEKVFEGTTVMQALMAHVNKAPIPLRERAPKAKISAAVESLVMKALSKDPADRYESAKAFIAAIDKALVNASPSATGAAQAASGSRADQTWIAEAVEVEKKAAGSRAPALVGALLVLTVGAGAAFFLGKRSTDRSESKSPVAINQPDPTRTRPIDTGHETMPPSGIVDRPSSPDPKPDPKPDPGLDRPLKPTAPPATETPTERPKAVPVEARPAVASVPDKPEATDEPEDEGDQPEAEPKPTSTDNPPPLPRPLDTGSTSTGSTSTGSTSTEPKPEPAKPEPTTPKATDPIPATPTAPPAVEVAPKDEPPAKAPEPQKTEPVAPATPKLDPAPTEPQPPREPKAPSPAEPAVAKIEPTPEEPSAPADPVAPPTPTPPSGPVVAPKTEPPAPTRYSLAVLPFSFRQEVLDTYAREVVWKIRVDQTNQLTAALSRALVNLKRFDVLDRDRVEAALREQDWDREGRLDPSRGAVYGRMMGASHLLLGEITKVSLQHEFISGGGFAKGQGTDIWRVSFEAEARIVESATTRIAAARKVLTVAEDKAPLSRERPLSESLTLELIRRAREELIMKLATELVQSAFPIRIAHVDGNEAILSYGSNAGLTIGQRLNVYQEGETILDPETGASLGRSRASLGLVEIIAVDEGLARVRCISGSLEPGAICEVVAVDPKPEIAPPPRKKAFDK